MDTKKVELTKKHMQELIADVVRLEEEKKELLERLKKFQTGEYSSTAYFDMNVANKQGGGNDGHS